MSFLSTPSGWRATFHLAVCKIIRRFLSTPSGWRATLPRGTAISLTWHFYPRPPGGGRPRGNFHGLYIEIFLSTPSGWRATAGITRFIDAGTDFYPRPPGGGRRHDDALFPEHKFAFLSTPSGWRATSYRSCRWFRQAISIHALRVEGDICLFWTSIRVTSFLSTPSGWRAT